jgi:hypothetical protein
VIVWEEVTVGRLVKISSSSVLPSLQLPTEKVNLKSFASMREREVQPLNTLLKLADELTAEKFNAGRLTSEEQPPKMLFTFVTAAVLNKGIETREKQLVNMPLAIVTAAVLSKGTLSSELQA